MIGNTHFDPVWEWKWDEAMSSIRATFRSALDRMNEYPDFIYSFSSPLVFEWIKNTDPEMFKEIQERVSEGRWELNEGWWNQPDCFSAGGESYIRQGLYGQRYLLENFGKYAVCGFNTDSFGHPDMFPQILKKSGILYYAFCRPEEKHYHLENPLFKWTSPDGSSVNAFRIGGKAGNTWDNNISTFINNIEIKDQDLLIVYGVTDHGGAPTKAAIESILKSENCCFSTQEQFFTDHIQTNTTINGEFLTGDFGVYCNNTRIKKLNRIAEHVLLNAESSYVLSNRNYQTDILKKCWQDVLFNQFHDILGGASIKEAYFDARNLYGRAIQTANEIMHYNLQSITAKLKMPGNNEENPWNLVLWNLNGCDYNGYIEAEIQWAHEFTWYDKGIQLEDANETIVNTQIIAEHSAIPKFRSRFIFKTDIPAFGCRCFKVIQNQDLPGRQNNLPTLTNESTEIIRESKKYIFTIDSQKGSLRSIVDKSNGKYLCKNLMVPTCYQDDGDTWCFNIESYGKKNGVFEVYDAKLVECGDLLSKIKIRSKYNNSLLTLCYTFYENEDFYDLAYEINWNEEHTVLKFNCDTNEKQVQASTPYSSMLRNETDKDVPMGEWIKAGSVLIVTDSCFAFNLNNQTLRLTILRSPIFGDLRIGEIQNREYSFSDQGITEGRFRVFFNDNHDFAPNEAVNFNNPPIVICETNHNGITSKNDFVKFDAKQASLTTIKYSENGDSIILRIVSYNSLSQIAHLELYKNIFDFTLSPYEIKTLKYQNGTLCESNMLEENI